MQRQAQRIFWRYSLTGSLCVAALALAGCSMTMTVDHIPGLPARTAATPAPPGPPVIPAGLPDANFLANADVAPPQNPPVAPRQTGINAFGELAGTPADSVQSGSGGLRQQTFPTAGGDADVSVDPSGKWMLFSSTRDGDHAALYLQSTGAPSLTQLTTGTADDTQGVFSPDHKRIAFSSNRTGRWHLFVMDADGRNAAQLTDGVCDDLHPSFSPDGSRLVYCSRGSEDNAPWEIWTINLRDKSQQRLGRGLFPCWSPDKTCDRIAFQKARSGGSRCFGLWTLELADGQVTRMTQVAASANAALVSPSWSPDGRSIAFAAIVEPADARQGKPAGQQDIWIMNADGTGRRRLTDGAGSNLTPCWAADDRVYFISDRAGHDSIWSGAAVNQNGSVTATTDDGRDTP
jgi:Tol biopolymer transport system component